MHLFLAIDRRQDIMIYRVTSNKNVSSLCIHDIFFCSNHYFRGLSIDYQNRPWREPWIDYKSIWKKKQFKTIIFQTSQRHEKNVNRDNDVDSARLLEMVMSIKFFENECHSIDEISLFLGHCQRENLFNLKTHVHGHKNLKSDAERPSCIISSILFAFVHTGRLRRPHWYPWKFAATVDCYFTQ
jgi:hypothetical protein